MSLPGRYRRIGLVAGYPQGKYKDRDAGIDSNDGKSLALNPNVPNYSDCVLSVLGSLERGFSSGIGSCAVPLRKPGEPRVPGLIPGFAHWIQLQFIAQQSLAEF